MTNRYLSFDLETLGEPIVQIGACVFDIDGNTHEEFARTISIDDLHNYPELQFSYNTVQWWLTQSKEAQQAVFEAPNKVSLRTAMVDFHDWALNLPGYEEMTYWSHASYDPPRLEKCRASAFKFLPSGIAPKLNYRQFRDIHTLLDNYTILTGKKKLTLSVKAPTTSLLTMLNTKQNTSPLACGKYTH